MKKIRINELARECEQPNSVILALLPQFGITEKKTHSSSVDEETAQKIRRYFGIVSEPEAPPAPPAEQVTEAVVQAAEPAPVAATQPESPSVEPAAPEPPPTIAEAPPPTPQPALDAVALLARPAKPIRPPLAGRGPVKEPVAEAAPPVAVQPAPPPSPGVAAPPSPSTPPPGVTTQAPPPKPGQIISGPRQPLPPDKLRVVRPAAAARPPAIPQVPVPPAQAVTPPSAVVVGKPAPAPGRPPVVGQPAARPVVPPRPELVQRIAQTRAMPGQPQPRPGMPARPTSPPVPGQPIYKGPVRPGQPLVRAKSGAVPGVAPRARGVHPTTPLRPEPVAPPPADGRRLPERKQPRAVDRELEREEKVLRRPIVRREEPARPAEGKQITVAEGITVKELSEKLGLKASVVIKKLVEDKKVFATINQTLDVKLAEEVAREFGAQVTQVSFEQEAEAQLQLEHGPEDQDLVKRPPVVTVMGHVDHGKTSLLDAIRESNVAEREAGGITQHIGAYAVEKDGRKIVFIDTPGHEAFTRMRARGAKVTDIVVLVVAADDGVMPQTLEAIDHARAAGVPIVVAINKIDKPEAQPERVKQQLSDRGLVPEEWGGETVMVPVSARTRQNLDLLLEMILLVADMQELKANPNRPAVGTVLEARLDKGRGPVATVLISNGTLRVGDFVICGAVFGKVRAMFDDRGLSVSEAGPSSPVEVLGLDSLPDVGETMQVVADTAKAKQIVMYREAKAREQSLARTARASLEQLHAQLKEGETKELLLVVKADVRGTAEVLTETLQKLSNEKVQIRVIHAGVGAITENDVLLASASNAVIIGFNVRPDRNAAAVAEQEKVDIRLHTVIYELTDEIKRAMAGMLEPVIKEVYRGRAEVRETFRISKVGTVAGCLVVDGYLSRDSEVRVLRDNVVVYTGKIASLKRFKDDAQEVKAGLECGVAIENFNDIKPGDVLEAFVREQVAVEALV